MAANSEHYVLSNSWFATSGNRAAACDHRWEGCWKSGSAPRFDVGFGDAPGHPQEVCLAQLGPREHAAPRSGSAAPVSARLWRVERGFGGFGILTQGFETRLRDRCVAVRRWSAQGECLFCTRAAGIQHFLRTWLAFPLSMAVRLSASVLPQPRLLDTAPGAPPTHWKQTVFTRDHSDPLPFGFLSYAKILWSCLVYRMMILCHLVKPYTLHPMRKPKPLQS